MFSVGTLGEAGFHGWWGLTDLFRASLSGDAWGPRGNTLQSPAVNLEGQQPQSLCLSVSLPLPLSLMPLT